ncbi:hypothetical protein MicloDRAFT_00069930 [Microvirga lotononidis]|uniref:Winged helix-turn helix domain-containing protein n=2 Tax=Microvirga lotononidis TaxID=864069 RepID=I4YK48_9HYPH|nr:hypothetical protein MicloDRAFT_00069930 [Microvirga lotononidis]
MAAGFATERWTLKRIAALIEREFQIHYHQRYLERPLKAHGLSVQRPATWICFSLDTAGECVGAEVCVQAVGAWVQTWRVPCRFTQP